MGSLKKSADRRGLDIEFELQPQLFELAISRAELEAAKQLLKESTGASSLFIDLTRSYFAEVLGNLRDRLSKIVGVEAERLDDIENKSKEDIYVRIIENGRQVMKVLDFLPEITLPDEYTTMRDSVRKFVTEIVQPQAERIHRQDLIIPEDIIRGVSELGCFALSVPEKYGGLEFGSDGNSKGMVIATEELSRGSLGAAGSLSTRPEIMVRALLEGGTAQQQRRWLPRIADGSQLVAISVTEPATGSDVANVALRAERVEGGWILTGAKTWCTFAGKAHLILLLARTDSDAVPPHRGLSLFVIEKPSTAGHEFVVRSAGGGSLEGRSISTVGYRGMHSFEMMFDQFFVPSNQLVGEDAGINRGFYYTMRGFSGGRLQTAARANGLMHAALAEAIRYASERTVFGRRISEFSMTRYKIGRMAMYLLATKVFSLFVAEKLDKNQGQLEASLVKLLACRYAEWVTREAMQLHGGMGYAEEVAVSRFFLDARVLSIFEGTEETLALRVIAKTMLDDLAAAS